MWLILIPALTLGFVLLIAAWNLWRSQKPREPVSDSWSFIVFDSNSRPDSGSTGKED